MPIDLVGVGHSYASAGEVLRNVELTIDEGKSLAIVGPSGSGKTTLLSVIGLLLRPSRGQVRVDGIAVDWRRGSLSRYRAELFGWVFQTANVLGRRSVADNVALGCLSRGLSRSATRERVGAALGLVGLEPYRDEIAFSLSGGELQRVQIARALAAGPRFILADEPTGQLDRRTSQQVADALLDGLRAGTSLVIATHDREMSERCHEVWELVDGRLVPR